MNDRAWYEVPSMVIASFAGAMSLALLQDRLTWRRFAVMVFVGLCASLFLTPWLCQLTGREDQATLSAAGYIVGLSGMTVVRTIITLVENHGNDLAQTIAKIFFGKNSRPKQ